VNYIFDLGAVLFTWRPQHLVLEAFPKRVHTAMDAAHLAHAIFGHEDWLDFDRGTREIGEVTERTALRLSLDLEDLGRLLYGIGDGLIPIDGTVQILNGLRQKRLAGDGVDGLYFLSNMSRPFARVLEQKHAFMGWFDGGVFSADVGLIKPEPAIYQHVQERFGLVPQNITFIDDMHYNVDAARLQGWRGIQFMDPVQLERELAA
jgi:putative hydrolase of the HAD superfamily